MSDDQIIAFERVSEVLSSILELLRDPVPGRDATIDELDDTIGELNDIIERRKRINGE